MQCASAVLSSVACPALQYLSTLSHKQQDFRKKKKLLNTKRVFWFSLQLLSETFFILRRTERDVITNVYWSLCKVRVILVRFKWNLHFLERLSKNNHISNFKKSIQWQPSCSMRTDRRTDMTKLIVAFHNFAKAPKPNTEYGRMAYMIMDRIKWGKRTKYSKE